MYMLMILTTKEFFKSRRVFALGALCYSWFSYLCIISWP